MSHLPPQQRKRQLLKMRQKLIDEMEKDTKEINSLKKMSSVKNFGDGGQVQQKINEATNRLNTKSQRLRQINEWLNETEIALNGKLKTDYEHETEHASAEVSKYDYNQMDTSGSGQFSEQSGSQMDVSRNSGYRDSFEVTLDHVIHSQMFRMNHLKGPLQLVSTISKKLEKDA